MYDTICGPTTLYFLCVFLFVVSMSKNGCINADTASHKLALRLETKPLHVLLRILDQKAVVHISNHSHPQANPKETHLYHQSVGNTVIKCHKLCASTAPHQGGKSKSSSDIARITHATIKPGQAAHIRLVF
jgi:hypothetical protein